MSEVSSILTRVATAADERALSELDAISWTALSGFPSVLQGIKAATKFFDERHPPEVHLVAELDGNVAGYVRLQPPTPLPENSHVLQITGIAVDPQARGHGVGGALLTHAARHAAELGARKLTLRVFSTNEPALRLYHRAGFAQEGVLRQEFLIDGQYIDDVLMAKSLTDQ